jgi:NADH-quinone oxidoreductase subunit A
MGNMLLSPLIAFSTVLLIAAILARFLSAFSYRKRAQPGGMDKSYACGEDVPTHLMQPDYSQFFPFAFFFTILHVVALTLATVPIETIESFQIAIVYLLGALAALFIIFRR